MGKKKLTDRAATTAQEGGNVFGADPHKRTVTASVLDERGGVLGTATFRVSGDGHRAMEAWALQFGPIARWGIEGATGLGRHTAMYLIHQGPRRARCLPDPHRRALQAAPAGQDRCPRLCPGRP